MEFHKKLQELRKQKGLTQEELAAALFVSRTAVSKWESGRGYPNIESLKAIAKLFGVTVDRLLSGDELLTLAEADSQRREKLSRDLVFGLTDIAVSMLLFLPLFAQRADGAIKAVSLLSLTTVSSYLRIAYFVFVAATAVWGILTLALQNCQHIFWLKIKSKLSLLLTIGCVLLFILSLQPYAAVFLFIFLTVKVFLLIKKQ
jgi:transcriptional regulator with XRE-family HTH domain